jgi:hypothetical protein
MSPDSLFLTLSSFGAVGLSAAVGLIMPRRSKWHRGLAIVVAVAVFVVCTRAAAIAYPVIYYRRLDDTSIVYLLELATVVGLLWGWGWLRFLVAAALVWRAFIVIPSAIADAIDGGWSNLRLGECADAVSCAYAVGLSALLLLPPGIRVFLNDPGDPPASPGFCAACGYNLTGNVSGRCPECGRSVPARTGVNDSRGCCV